MPKITTHNRKEVAIGWGLGMIGAARGVIEMLSLDASNNKYEIIPRLKTLFHVGSLAVETVTEIEESVATTLTLAEAQAATEVETADASPLLAA